MSRTLPLAQHLLAIGRNLNRNGQTYAATQLMHKVCALRAMPKDVAEEARGLLAELYLQSGQFKKARRRLSAALTAASDNAYYHRLMAEAIEDDEDGDPERALFHYRSCVRLEPDNATYWCALGVLAAHVREMDEASEALARAVALAPDDMDILDQAVRALWDAGELSQAQKLIQTALFRNPHDQRCRDFWAQQKFQQLHAEQKEENRQARFGKGYAAILRFTAPKSDSTPVEHIRHDLPSGLPGPKRPLPRRASGKRKAHP